MALASLALTVGTSLGLGSVSPSDSSFSRQLRDRNLFLASDPGDHPPAWADCQASWHPTRARRKVDGSNVSSEEDMGVFLNIVLMLLIITLY